MGVYGRIGKAFMQGTTPPQACGKRGSPLTTSKRVTTTVSRLRVSLRSLAAPRQAAVAYYDVVAKATTTT